MLDAGQRTGRVVVLVMDMKEIGFDSFFHIVGKKVLIHIRLCRFRGELHHHAGRSVGIHVRVLTGDIVGLGLYDGIKDFLRVGFPGHVPLLSIPDVLLCRILTGRIHENILYVLMNPVHRNGRGFVLLTEIQT